VLHLNAPVSSALFLFVGETSPSARARKVTDHPTASWTGQQMVQAFPEEKAPRCLLREG
jgi:hypothetical protein